MEVRLMANTLIQEKKLEIERDQVLFQTSCYCLAKLSRPHNDTSTTWFQTSNLFQSNWTERLLPKTKRKKRFSKLLNVFYHNSRIEFGTAVARVARRLKPSRATAVLHGSTTTWFQTSRFCRAKVEFDSAINLVRHGSNTTFETGLSVA